MFLYNSAYWPCVTDLSPFHAFPDKKPDNPGRYIAAVRDGPAWSNILRRCDIINSRSEHGGQRDLPDRLQYTVLPETLPVYARMAPGRPSKAKRKKTDSLGAYKDPDGLQVVFLDIRRLQPLRPHDAYEMTLGCPVFILLVTFGAWMYISQQLQTQLATVEMNILAAEVIVLVQKLQLEARTEKKKTEEKT